MSTQGIIVHAVSGTTLLLLTAGWFILLGGVSKVQKVCDGRCRDRTGLYWWIIWFQFLALLLWPAVQFLEGLRAGKTSLIAIFAILATLQMYGADTALDNTDSGTFSRGYKTTASGFVILATFNLVAILLLGFLAGEGDELAGGGGGDTTTYNNPVAKSGSVPDSNPRPFRTASNAHNLGTPGSGNTPPPPAPV